MIIMAVPFRFETLLAFNQEPGSFPGGINLVGRAEVSFVRLRFYREALHALHGFPFQPLARPKSHCVAAFRVNGHNTQFKAPF